MTEELAKSFEPSEIEKKWYPLWEANGCFRARMDPDKPSFSIQLPPPNITGILHMGHAFNQSVTDTLARYHRMMGENVAWIPGTDHAGISTQIVVERQVEKEGKTIKDFTREAFIARIWEWQKFSGGTILKQMRTLGDSLDWERLYFTMDDKLSKVVTECFVRLYEDGLIYRGKRLCNWDPSLKSAVCDLEVESEEEDGFLWEIRYPGADGSEGLVVATTRPETLFGDQAVAVHPQDERYAGLVGKKLVLPLCDREIPVIADAYVDREFGSGCVKITPAHDFNDFEVGERHNLEKLSILDETAHINANAPAKYRGMERYEARRAVVEDLEALGLLVSVKKHRHMVPRVARTGEAVEPFLSEQWFLNMNGKAPETAHFPGKTMGEIGLDAVNSGEIRILPEEWVGVYRQWLENLRNWCISRQLVWGHQIPAWYDAQGNVYVARNEAEAQAKAGDGVALTRDPDVLDTWFSSALVPFSTLGWPDEKRQKEEGFDLFLPSSIMVTGYDIIFFWVARMIMMTRYFTGRIPFKTVYLHGLVRDAEGKKMSKSEGNTLDPMDIIQGTDLERLIEKNTRGLRKPEKAPMVAAKLRENYPEGIAAMGADALRFTMAAYATLGRNINFDMKRVAGYRNFCNKLWNATRFVLMNCEGKDCGTAGDAELAYGFVDNWINNAFERTVKEVHAAFAEWRLDNMANAIYSFVWDEYCDWYLEAAKVRLANGTPAEQRATRRTLITVLEKILRMAHPVIPFITEELWQKVAPIAGVAAGENATVMLAPYPLSTGLCDAACDLRMALTKDMIEAVRNLRGAMRIAPSEKLPLAIQGDARVVDSVAPYLRHLARVSEVRHVEDIDSVATNAVAPVQIVGDFKLKLVVEIDLEAEKSRLSKEIARVRGQIASSSAKLENPSFVQRAPQAVVEQERKRLEDATQLLAQLEGQLAKLQA